MAKHFIQRAGLLALLENLVRVDRQLRGQLPHKRAPARPLRHRFARRRIVCALLVAVLIAPALATIYIGA